jgi:RimJ/RimL family protein N-acetyltransferase
MMDTVTLRPPTLEECQQVRIWRNAPDVLPMLRTKEPLTEEQQAAFYRDVVCNPDSNHRYYALDWQPPTIDVTTFMDEVPKWHTPPPVFVGLGGLTYLDRIPCEAEISLLLGPQWRGRGLGTAAVDALLVEAFYGPLALKAVCGECYKQSPALHFWIEMAARMVNHTRAGGLVMGAFRLNGEEQDFRWKWLK